MAYTWKNQIDQNKSSSASSQSNSTKGFGIVLLLASLPVCLGFLVLFFSTAQLLQKIEKGRFICRAGLIQTLERASIPMRVLLGTSPLAAKLRQMRNVTQSQLLAAMSTGNTALVAALKARLAMIVAEQKGLHAHQNLLYLQAQKILEVGHKEVQWQLLQSVKPPLRVSLVRQLTVAPALVPIDEHLAPPWRIKDRFEIEQKQAQSWHLEFFVEKPWASWMKGKAKIPLSCVVSLKQGDKKWVAILKEDRSSLRAY